MGPRDATLFSWAYRFHPEYTNIAFDPEWHRPARILCDVPETADDETLVELIEFEPAS